ncbi:MAG: hypothetical protein ACP5G1_00015 [Nanopusillaceae archaeon]
MVDYYNLPPYLRTSWRYDNEKDCSKRFDCPDLILFYSIIEGVRNGKGNVYTLRFNNKNLEKILRELNLNEKNVGYSALRLAIYNKLEMISECFTGIEKTKRKDKVEYILYLKSELAEKIKNIYSEAERLFGEGSTNIIPKLEYVISRLLMNSKYNLYICYNRKNQDFR